MSKDKKQQTKPRLRYLFGFGMILIIALWMTSCPTKIFDNTQRPTYKTQRRNDPRLIEVKKEYKTGRNVPVFQRMFIAPVIDDENLTILFTDHSDYSGLLDSMAGRGWKEHGRYGLNSSIPALLSHYEDSLQPFVYGQWQQKKLRVPDTAHFIVQVQIESVAMTKTQSRERKWQYFAYDQFGNEDSAWIDLCHEIKKVEIKAMLKITKPDGVQVLRRPISALKIHDNCYYHRQGAQALLAKAPIMLSNDKGGHVMSSYRDWHVSDSDVVLGGVFNLSKEATRCLGKWLLTPIVTARKRRGSIFDIREGTITKREYINDTSRVIDSQPHIPIYKPFKK